MSTPRLPHEMWLQVLQDTHRNDLRICLGVCRLWRTFAIRLLFRTVRLYFGEWASVYTRSGCDCDDCCLSEPDYLNERSLEILEHIISNPVFASVVKGIVVHSLYFSYRNEISLGRLTDALKVLPHLESFDWHAECQEDIMLAISESCPNLRHLGLPAFSQGHNLGSFRQLRSICTTSPSSFCDGYQQRHVAATHEVFLNFRNATLSRLQLLKCPLDAAPMHLLVQLRELHLVHPRNLGTLDQLFKRLPCLETLSLVYVEQPQADLFTALEKSADMLPQLTSITMSLNETNPLSPGQTHQLIEFLRGHTSMRALCINNRLPWEVFWQVANAIGNMKSLQALGLSITSPTPESLAFWNPWPPGATPLPKSLEAVSLDMEFAQVQSFLECLPELPRLRSFFLCNECGEDKEQVSTRSLAEMMPHLTIVGCAEDICDVRWTTAGIELYHWTRLKRDTRGRDSFDAPFDAWLLRNNPYLASISLPLFGPDGL
ncbi:hypothetical protein BJ138DRAFT_1127212 [Hygrophoropsis aurantiaca]|uniref:Uncharacterized protein n=1 Tax=Hygrophoropsis aurantiaca TaxID=72124 RepID=A0ACB8A9A8_9AGAM|nr:hypothetical protein BJ138DRAFT_1127212 [Hygrophoropsis aurantiaca]